METERRGEERTEKSRPDTRLPQSRAGGQELYLRSLHHLGRNSEATDRKKTKKVKCAGWTDGPTNGLTKRVVESRARDKKIRNPGKEVLMTE